MSVNPLCIHPRPLPGHDGICPGQRRRSRLGTVYDVFAVMSDGYVWCETPHRGGKTVKRIWCDVIEGWEIV